MYIPLSKYTLLIIIQLMQYPVRVLLDCHLQIIIHYALLLDVTANRNYIILIINLMACTMLFVNIYLNIILMVHILILITNKYLKLRFLFNLLSMCFNVYYIFLSVIIWRVLLDVKLLVSFLKILGLRFNCLL